LTSAGWTAVASQKALLSSGAQRLFFWRPGDAACSRLHDPASRRIDSAAFHHGRAYLIDAAWRLRIYDLGASPPRLVRNTSLRPSAVKVFNASGRSSFQVLRTLHAVPCGGECLLVLTYGGHRPAPPAEVYRVDWAAEPLVEIGERVRDLGEHSLFVGRIRALGEGVPGRPEELRLRRGARQLLAGGVVGDHLRPGVEILGTNPLPR
jgi:hypothetical protein